MVAQPYDLASPPFEMDPAFEQPAEESQVAQSQRDRLIRIRHTCAHLLAMAVQRLYPGTRVATGPWTETGFFYDFEVPIQLTESDLPKIEAEMRRLIRANLPIIREVVERQEIQAEIERLQEPYKQQILQRIPEGETITRYFIGNPDSGRWRQPGKAPEGSLFQPYVLPSEEVWWDLCAGPHLNFTGEIHPEAFALESVGGAYWQGDETQPQLQRIYGTAWETPEELQAYLRQKEEAAKRDHRKLGKELDLFSLQEAAGGGLVFWHPKGSQMRLIIEDYWRKAHLQAGYELLYTPHLANLDLWKTSGHFEFYRDSMFEAMQVEQQQYQLKPMNCPFHVLTYQRHLHSYRELPIRYAELGTVYRYERSGTLHGLMRVRGFTQDDAHIFCRPDQLQNEILGVLNLTEQVLSDFGFAEYEIHLSTRPSPSVGSDEVWQLATAALKGSLEAKGWTYQIDEGGGAFYGPKIDLKIKDAIGRLWQCSTIQVDFNLPERFEIGYVNQDGSRKRPIMIHRAIFGSLERFFGILIENYAGDFPLWLAPVQMRICPVTQAQHEYARQLMQQFRSWGYRVDVDQSQDRLAKQIRNAELQRIPIIAVVGKQEAQSQTLSVRTRKQGDLGSQTIEQVIEMMAKAVSSHTTV
ncbi:MAG: threonine--tRNA ligase [Thermostichus sp. DG02_3_bins_51]